MKTALPRRRPAWLRLVAIGLLLLAASPLTAPFATIELAAAAPAAPSWDSGKIKGLDDSLVTTFRLDAAPLPSRIAFALTADENRPRLPFDGFRTILRV